jgi:hypothetical protein
MVAAERGSKFFLTKNQPESLIFNNLRDLSRIFQPLQITLHPDLARHWQPLTTGLGISEQELPFVHLFVTHLYRNDAYSSVLHNLL